MNKSRHSIQLSNLDRDRLLLIDFDTYCEWLEGKGHLLISESATKTIYGYIPPPGGEWFQDALLIVHNDGLGCIKNSEVVRLWSMWAPGDTTENIETAIKELEKLQVSMRIPMVDDK